MQWLNIIDIATALEETHPETKILGLSFPTLRQMVMDLPGFEGDVKSCNEKILEAIQQAWLEERD